MIIKISFYLKLKMIQCITLVEQADFVIEYLTLFNNSIKLISARDSL